MGGTEATPTNTVVATRIIPQSAILSKAMHMVGTTEADPY